MKKIGLLLNRCDDFWREAFGRDLLLQLCKEDMKLRKKFPLYFCFEDFSFVYATGMCETEVEMF